MRRGALRAAGALLLLAALGSSVGCGRRAGGSRPPETTDVAGIEARLAAARGRPVLLSFWATWCRPCVEELPDLVALHADRDNGVRVVAVSLDAFLSGAAAAPGVVADFLRATPAPLDHVVYAGTQDSLFGAFELPGSIPYAILYDADGQLVRRFEESASAPEVRAALAATRGSSHRVSAVRPSPARR